MPKRVPRYLKRPERRSVRGEELWLPAPTLAGITVTPDSALTLTAAYACINVLATDAACLHFGAYQHRSDGSKVPRIDLPQHELVHFSPDGEATSVNFRQALLGHTLGWGNGYAEIRRKGDGRPASLHLLDPGTIRPRRLDGRLVYEQTTGGPNLPAANVLHVAGLGWDGVMGYSPPKMARQAIALGLAAEAFGAAFFGNGAHPSGYIKSLKKLSGEAIKRLIEQHEYRHQGPANSNRIGVLEEGMDYIKTSIDPEDAQFLETRKFQVIELARLYRVPPHKIGDYSQSHLANIEAANLDYLMTSLLPWLVIVEQQCNLKLLSRAERAQGLCFEHNLNTLLRGDMKARALYYKEMFAMGAFSPSLIAQMEGHNPIPAEDGGTKRFVPLNLIRLDLAGELPETPEPGAAAEPTEPTEPDEPDEDEPDEPDTGEPDDGDSGA